MTEQCQQLRSNGEVPLVAKPEGWPTCTVIGYLASLFEHKAGIITDAQTY